MNVRSYGTAALLVELDSAAEVSTLRSSLDARSPVGMIEAMPGLCTVLIRFDPSLTDATRMADALRGVRLEPSDAQRTNASEGAIDAVVLRVDYSGPDLDDVAAHTGLTTEEVITAHQAAHYRVALIGMAPGFYFLSGGDARLNSPRRASPRTDVPKGAVGLAGAFTGIYPRVGPGGWQLIGRVLDDLWHPTRIPAALLAPGTPVTFTAA